MRFPRVPTTATRVTSCRIYIPPRKRPCCTGPPSSTARRSPSTRSPERWCRAYWRVPSCPDRAMRQTESSRRPHRASHPRWSTATASSLRRVWESRWIPSAMARPRSAPLGASSTIRAPMREPWAISSLIRPRSIHRPCTTALYRRQPTGPACSRRATSRVISILHAKMVTSYHANFELQRSIGLGTVVKAAYVGSFGRHLGQNVQITLFPMARSSCRRTRIRRPTRR